MPPRGLGLAPIAGSEIYIVQTFLNVRSPRLPVKVIQESRLSTSDLDWLLESNGEEMKEVLGLGLGSGWETGAKEEGNVPDPERQSIGMHIMYSKSGHLAALAVCLSRKVLVITEIIKPKANRPYRPSDARRALQNKFLSASSGFRTCAFNAHQLVLGLHRDMSLSCARTVDILSLPPRNRDVVQTVKKIAGDKQMVFEEAVREGFQVLLYDKKNGSDTTLAEVAWLAWLIGNLPEAQLDLMGVPVIDSSKFSKVELDALALNMDALTIRELEKPMEETIDVSSAPFTVQGDRASFKQSSYGKRLRTSHGQSLKADVAGSVALSASVIGTNGQRASLRVPNLGHLNDPSIRSMTISGRPESTRAEQRQSMTILETLQRKSPLLDDPWVKRLFPSLHDTSAEHDENAFGVPVTLSGDGWDVSDSRASKAVSYDTLINKTNGACERMAPKDNGIDHQDQMIPYNNEEAADSMELSDMASTWSHDTPVDQQLPSFGNLNYSQTQAVLDMLDFNKDVSIIQGPPGTGKTTVIASYVAEILLQLKSRKACLIVAQSNVAIKNVGEKLYHAGISDWILVVSSEFLTGCIYMSSSQALIVLSSKDIKGKLYTRVVLCTLSMLSNPKFASATRHLNVQSIIVEEASQIPMSSYLPILAQYRRHLKKISFIGDDKQLPPYASENTEALQSIFENSALLDSISAIMLDIQYRMPIAIGDFISRQVYQSQLASWDGHPVQHPLCVQFINVDGVEEPDKSSFKNTLEASTCISIATLLNQRQQSFKIITPYDTQRDLLEERLRASGLSWSNTCFTVDSFQGNEGDYIIISIVRTKLVGFLQNLRRSNVMLSRAKKGMYICSSRRFLESHGARDTLMGRMAKEWSRIEGGWVEGVDNLERML